MSYYRNKGFTLIELMIVLAIVGIVAGFAFSSYKNSVQKSRRSDGMAALSNATAMQEKWYFQFNQYSSDANDVGGISSPENYYTISVDQPCGNSSCYRMIATAVGVQANDTNCLVFTVDNTRAKRSYSDSPGGTVTTDCW